MKPKIDPETKRRLAYKLERILPELAEWILSPTGQSITFPIATELLRDIRDDNDDVIPYIRLEIRLR